MVCSVQAVNNSEQTPEQLMIKINDAAKQLAVTPITIRRGIRAGTIKALKKQRGPKAFTYLLSPDEVSRLKKQRARELVHEQMGNSEQGSAPVMSNSEKQPSQDDEQVESKSNSAVDGLIELVREQNLTITQLQQELRSVGETATTFQVKNKMLREQSGLIQAQNELLQGQIQKLLPPPAEQVEPEPEPKHRRWYYLWLKAA